MRGAARARPGLAGEALWRLLLVLRRHLLVLLRLLRGVLVLRRLRGLCVRGLLLPVELLRRHRLVWGRMLGRGCLLGVLGLRGLLPSLLLSGGLPARGLLRGGSLLLRGVAGGLRMGVGPGGNGRAGEVQPRSVGGVSEVNGRARADLQVLDALAPHLGAIGAAVVLDGPTVPIPVHGGVPPRDSGVLQHHVALRIAHEAI